MDDSKKWTIHDPQNSLCLSVFVFFISPSDWTRLIRSQLSAAFVLGVTLHGDWSCSVEYGFVNGALPNLTVDHHFSHESCYLDLFGLSPNWECCRNPPVGSYS